MQPKSIVVDGIAVFTQPGQFTAIVACVLLVLLCIWQWRRRKVAVKPLSKGWSEFAKKVQTALKNRQQLQLQIWQSEVLDESNAQALVAMLNDSHLLACCRHEQQLWLLWQNLDEMTALSQAQRQLSAFQQLLGSTWRCWQGDLKLLLGISIHPNAVAGLRHLVTHSFNQHPNEQAPLQFLLAECTQAVPCSWHGENVQADIQNALQLGLLHITEQPLNWAKTA